MNTAEEWISDLKDRIMEIMQSGQQTENQMKKHESNIWDLWDNIKQANLHIIGIPEGKEKEKHKQDEQGQESFPVKRTGEFTWSSKQWNRPLQSNRHWVQKGR